MENQTITSAKIDWLTFTSKNFAGVESPNNVYFAKELGVSIMSDILGKDDWSIEFERQEGFYPWVFKIHPYGITIAISTKLTEQGVRVVFPGKATGDEMLLASWMQGMVGRSWNCTRVDVAVDVVGVPYSWPELRVVAQDFCEDKGRALGVFQSGKGCTINIGSRYSDNMVRIYDKGAEQKVDYPWTRIEMECKGEIAKMLWEMNRGLLKNALKHMAAWMEGFHHNVYQRVLEQAQGDAALIRPGRKGVTDRERWLDAAVLPALRSFHAEEPEAAWRWIVKAQAMLDALEHM